ncbi:MAG: carboxypeptidase-like regulatory domain-containing protein [Chitinophagaceae bacterium]|nr:carboxypeptidase-like regulatory domain-containing protein [Chitinophagaceae bacterium]
MKYFNIFIFLIILCNQQLYGQSSLVKGMLYDSTLKKPVANATITLLQKKDSSLVSFSMTRNNGQFELTGLAHGEYRLLLTHTSYHTINKYFTISEVKKNIELGTIFLTDRATTLDEVVIANETPPVTLVGDTIQYNAASFKTKPNANVEDLLKKLPGVKVDKDGNVKAQGEKVQKVLVDGKEFFGNDPKLATKNLPADAVDKVQVYDKQSDQAQLTGFDDGNSEKTINLKLKKDKKKGLFGKAMAGAGTGNRYQGRFNVNSFKGARQMSVIGMGNNSNAEGFSFMDILNFTGAMNQMRGLGNGSGEISMNISQDDPLAGLIGGNNNGINTTFGSGVNYNNIIGNKTDFRSNYFFSRFNPYRQSSLQRQYFTPANLYRQNGYTDNLNLSHRLNINADIQLDSFNSVKITSAFSQQDTKNKTRSDYSTLSQSNKLINDGYSNYDTENSGYNLNAGILYRKKFHRRGRTFSVNLQGNLNNSNGSGKLASLTGFYNTDGSLLNRDSVNQHNANSSDMNGYNARIAYTEPVFKRSLIEFSVGNSYNKNTAGKETFDYNQLNGKFDLPNADLTNHYISTYNTVNTGLRFRKQTKNTIMLQASLCSRQGWKADQAAATASSLPSKRIQQPVAQCQVSIPVQQVQEHHIKLYYQHQPAFHHRCSRYPITATGC